METERDLRGDEEGQMAVEMALLLPIYFLLMFTVFVFSDWFRVVNSVDQATFNLTRGEGQVQQNHVQPYFGNPIDDFGTLETVRTPSYQEQGPDATDLASIRYAGFLFSENGQCNEANTGIRNAGVLQMIMVRLWLERGVKRNADGRSHVAFKYDNHRYWNAYDSQYTKPEPLLRMTSSGSAPAISGDGTRHNGKWYSHPIQGMDEFTPTRFHASTRPYGPIPHNFLVSNAFYKRHLGWLGYDWSFLSNPTPVVDALNPVSPDTYHPRHYMQTNYLHFNTLIRLGF